MGRVRIDTALAEITLRKYEPPGGLTGRELVKKFCLSMGLLQPGDSRDVVVDVLMVLLKTKKELTSVEVEQLVIENRKEAALEKLGVASSNIRRQLLRLRDLLLVEKNKNNYSIKEGSSISTLFNEHIQEYYLKSIISRVKEYTKAVDKEFGL